MKNIILSTAFDNIASGVNTHYWMALIRAFKGMAIGRRLNTEEQRGYRIGQRMRAFHVTME